MNILPSQFESFLIKSKSPDDMVQYFVSFICMTRTSSLMSHTSGQLLSSSSTLGFVCEYWHDQQSTYDSVSICVNINVK